VKRLNLSLKFVEMLKEKTMTYCTQLIAEVEARIQNGGQITREEAHVLLNVPNEDLMCLAAAADRVRIHFKGNAFDACSLINAKSGRCAEDCAFCAQSAEHSSDCQIYGLVSGDEILKAAEDASQFGASRFCTVTSGGALSEKDFDDLLLSLSRLKREVDIALDASLGFLDESRAQRLFQAGVSRYNHNLETSRDYFPDICSTHSFEARVNTVETVKKQGMSACSGGIIGLGETENERLALAFNLAELGVDCVPINILNPRPGTRLAQQEPLPPMEIVKTVALFRLILPSATIKIAGGRETNLRDFQGLAFRSGANGMIVGGYLTTTGRCVDDDLDLIRQAGFELLRG